MKISEPEKHKRLKEKVRRWLKNECGFTPDQITFEYQVHHDNRYYLVDVAAISEEKSIAVECGHLTGTADYASNRMTVLKERFDEVHRFSYLYAGQKEIAETPTHNPALAEEDSFEVPSDVVASLREHGLTPETAVKFVGARPKNNMQDTAQDMEMNVATAKRYRDAFQSMDDETFWTVVATIAHRRLNEITDDDMQGGDSE